MKTIKRYTDSEYILRDESGGLVCPKCQSKKMVCVGGEPWSSYLVCGGCLSQFTFTPTDMGQTLEFFDEVEALPRDAMVRYQAHETLRHHFELAKAKAPHESWADFDHDLNLEKTFILDAMVDFIIKFQKTILLP